VRLLALARDLRRRKARERQGLFVAEGVRAVEELLRAAAGGRLIVRGALAAPALAQSDRGARCGRRSTRRTSRCSTSGSVSSPPPRTPTRRRACWPSPRRRSTR
jgi:hypothetical protein